MHSTRLLSLLAVAVLCLFAFARSAAPAAAAAGTSAGAKTKTTAKTKRGRCRAGTRRISRTASKSARRRAGRCRPARRRPAIKKPAATPAATTGAAPSAVPAASAAQAPGGCANTNVVPTAANLPAVRDAALCLVNVERAANSLSPLTDQAQLTQAARAHSESMTTAHFFSHQGSDGSTFAERIAAAGYPGTTLGENIAWGSGSQGTAQSIVASWMASPGHRANILRAAFRDSGLWVTPAAPNGGGATYTHDLGA